VLEPDRKTRNLGRMKLQLMLLSLMLVAVAAADALVWSLVLGNPVVDMEDQSVTSSTSDVAHPRNTKKITSSRPTRHHHAQVSTNTYFNCRVVFVNAGVGKLRSIKSR